MLKAGVVDQDVEAPEPADRSIDKVPDFGGLGNIGSNEVACRPQSFEFEPGTLAGNWVKIGNHTVGASHDECFGDGVTDTARRARNDGNFSLHRLPPWVPPTKCAACENFLDMITRIAVKPVGLAIQSERSLWTTVPEA
jgi:hypothetical protein